MEKKLLAAIAILVGTTMGAGFLGIPYVISKTGFLVGLFYLVFVALFIMTVKLYLGEISLRTNGNHQLAGYAGMYLGKLGKFLMFLAMFFGIYPALVAYLIGEGQSLSYIIFGNLNYAFYLSIAFWLLMSFLSYIGLKALKKYNKLALILVLLIVALILVFFIGSVKFDNLTYINKENWFLPLGVVMFSFLAFSAMPEVERVLSGKEKLMKKAIIFGSLIPLVVYLIYTFVIVGNFGLNVPEISTLALGRFFSILGVLTMFTAFFTLSLAIRDMFRFDFKLGRFIGWILSSFIPLILFLIIYYFKVFGFVEILSISGVISGGLTGILILLINKKAKENGNRKPEYSLGINWFIIILLSLLFLIGSVLEFLKY